MLTESIIDVRYPDCDPMGIVHHGVYPIWYEIARMDFFAAIGYSYSDMNREGINPPMVNLNLNYHSPVRYPGKVIVRTTCSLSQGKKLELKYNVYAPDSPTPVASATSFHIWTGPDMKSLDMTTRPDINEKLLSGVTTPAVLILSGGRSTRMGQDKANLELGGSTLLDRAISFWKEALPGARIYVSAGQRDHLLELPEDVTPIYDLQADQGPLGGLQAAFRQTEEKLFWVSAVDMPFLHPDAIKALSKKRHGCEDICVFTKDGKPEPLFGLYRSTALPQIEAVLEDSRRMSQVLDGCYTTRIPMNNESWLTNVNTPEDLIKAAE